jgi:hypothetical protein
MSSSRLHCSYAKRSIFRVRHCETGLQATLAGPCETRPLPAPRFNVFAMAEQPTRGHQVLRPWPHRLRIWGCLWLWLWLRITLVAGRTTCSIGFAGTVRREEKCSPTPRSTNILFWTEPEPEAPEARDLGPPWATPMLLPADTWPATNANRHRSLLLCSYSPLQRAPSYFHVANVGGRA